MKIDKLNKLYEILVEARTAAQDLQLSRGTSFYRKIIRLLVLLVKMQSLTTSFRADCIDELLSMNPNFPDNINPEKNLSHGKIIQFNRRISKAERRKLHTYLANDKRSGIAERRRRIKKLSAHEVTTQKTPCAPMSR